MPPNSIGYEKFFVEYYWNAPYPREVQSMDKLLYDMGYRREVSNEEVLLLLKNPQLFPMWVKDFIQNLLDLYENDIEICNRILLKKYKKRKCLITTSFGSIQHKYFTEEYDVLDIQHNTKKIICTRTELELNTKAHGAYRYLLEDELDKYLFERSFYIPQYDYSDPDISLFDIITLDYQECEEHGSIFKNECYSCRLQYKLQSYSTNVLDTLEFKGDGRYYGIELEFDSNPQQIGRAHV